MITRFRTAAATATATSITIHARPFLLSSTANIFTSQATRIMNLNLKHAMFATFVGTSSSWISPIPLSNERSVQNYRGQFSTRRHQQQSQQQQQQQQQQQSATQSLAMVTENAETPPSSSGSDVGNQRNNAAGQPIAKGSIINTFRGGLVTARIDDSLNSEALAGDLTGRQVIFDEDGRMGIVVVHRPPLVFVFKNGADNDDTLEGTVTVLDKLFSINISSDLQRADYFGRNFTSLLSSDTDNDIDTTTKSMNRPIFAPIPTVNQIALINDTIVTGVTMFDALAPIGRGQNMLFIGNDVEDMRRYAMDMISIQKSNEVKCVYASTGGVQNREQLQGIMSSVGLDQDDVILVSSNDDKSTQKRDDATNAVEAILTAATACAIGEIYALEKGMDTLVIVDNIDLHKQFWDVTTRSLVDVFGVDAVVKSDLDGGASSEMRAFFSSLVQRSAQFDTKRGGGSVTLLLLQTTPKIADDSDFIYSLDNFDGSPKKVIDRIKMLVSKNIPVTAANLRKIQIPVPSVEEGKRRLVFQHVDELISMTDGQIWLDENLKNSGRSPAMDFKRSVTRIGIGADTESRAEAPAITRIVEGLRLELSQAENMDGADIEKTASKKQMRNLQAWLLAMHQPPASGARKLSESCVALIAASCGALNDCIDNGILAGSDEGTKMMRSLSNYVNDKIPNCMEEIDSTLDFTSDSTKESIEKTIKAYFDTH